MDPRPRFRFRRQTAVERAEKRGTWGRVVENTGWLLSAKAVGAILSLVYLGIATRTLGPSGFGQFVLVLGTAQFIGSFVGFQTWQAVVRFGVEVEGEKPERLGPLIAFCLALDLAGAFAGCVLAAVAVVALGPFFGWTQTVQLEAFLFSLVMLLSIRSTATGVLRLHDKYGQGAAADAVTPIARLIGALIVLAAGPTVTRFLIAWAAAEVATATVYWFLASRTDGWKWPAHRKAIWTAPQHHPGLWQFVAITNAGSTLASISKHLSVLLVGLAVGPAAAGGYRLGHQLGQALARLSQLLSRAAFSELARMHVSGARDKLSALFRNTFLLALGAGVAIMFILFIGGKPLLGLVAGREFLSAYPLLLILGTAAALDMIGAGFEPTLMATNRAALAFKLRLATAAALLLLIGIMLPVMGATGAAIATLCASAFGLLLFGFTAWRAVHRHD